MVLCLGTDFQVPDAFYPCFFPDFCTERTWQMWCKHIIHVILEMIFSETHMYSWPTWPIVESMGDETLRLAFAYGERPDVQLAYAIQERVWIRYSVFSNVPPGLKSRAAKTLQKDVITLRYTHRNGTRLKPSNAHDTFLQAEA